MKSSTVWHGHSTRPSLPAGTARKARGSLPRGRRNRLILPPAKRNRAFPMGNALLYISLLYVDLIASFTSSAILNDLFTICNSRLLPTNQIVNCDGRVRPQGAPCFLFCFAPDDFNGVFLLEELCQFDIIPPQQLMRINR